MLAPLLLRLKTLIFRRACDAELDEELRYHLEREADRNVSNGMAPADARDAARRAFGNESIAREQARDAMRWLLLEELWQDVVYAIRTSRRAPTFAFTVVGTIGLGLGLLTTAFTLFDAYVLRPLAVRDPGSLYNIFWTSRNGHGRRFTWTQYQGLQKRNAVAESFAYANLISRMRGQPTIGQFVTGNYFRSLGIGATRGRTLQVEDTDAPGANAVVVLSYDTWQSMFGSDSSAIGQRVALNGVSLRIVGVAQKGFSGLESVPLQYWVPITMMGQVDPERDPFGPKPAESLLIVGRIRPGMTLDQTSQALVAWVQSFTVDLPAQQRAAEVTLTPKGTSIALTTEVIQVFSPIAIAFLLIMLIACANVANVMLARGLARQREIGIRLAMGASRGRLIRQLLTESVLLSVPAALAGYLLSRVSINLGLYGMFAMTPPSYRAYLRLMPLTPDTRIVLFMMAAR